MYSQRRELSWKLPTIHLCISVAIITPLLIQNPILVQRWETVHRLLVFLHNSQRGLCCEQPLKTVLHPDQRADLFSYYLKRFRFPKIRVPLSNTGRVVT